MKKIYTLALCLTSFFAFGQTSGNLTFTYTPTSHNGYSGTKNVLAIWIQNSNGDFVKTRERYVGLQTSDHLPTWAVNSGGSAFSALLPGSDVTDATTGATLTAFSTRTIQWDGTDVNGNVVPDGNYKITVESCWNHGSANKDLRSFTFTKGASDDVQTPTSDANFTNISLEWIAGATSIEEKEAPILLAYPNPTKGITNIEYDKCSNIKVVNIIGKVVLNLNITSHNKGFKTIDLSNFDNGVYTVIASGSNTYSSEVIILNK